MNFYSQFQEDRWIVANLQLPENGFFVEVGCGVDGVLNSNTKHFEEKGWNGFLIEADPSAIKKIQESRKAPVLNYALSNRDDYIDFYVYEDKEYSSTLLPNNNKISVKTIGFKSLLLNLGCNRKIDIMSIDTEGSEPDILEGMGNIRPQILIVEYNTANYRNDAKLISDILTKMDYHIKHKTTCNLIGYYKG